MLGGTSDSSQATGKPLRRGWSTGACATAGVVAAHRLFVSGVKPQRVQIDLPQGRQAVFSIFAAGLLTDGAWASVIKDAGDDPDVTDGAVINVRLRHRADARGVFFARADGVGVVTRKGLPLAVGEPAINPVPRAMMRHALGHGKKRAAWCIEVGIEDGVRLARTTWNPRLGIQDGLSILGTRGTVIPYSCSAWIHSIHRSVDVALAEGQCHLAAATGKTSESVLLSRYGFRHDTVIEMGDFVGGLVKYMRRKDKVASLTICGGFGKMAKLALGAFDLHSKRNPLSIERLLGLLPAERLSPSLRAAASAGEVLSLIRDESFDLPMRVAERAYRQLEPLVSFPLRIIVIDRMGVVIAGYPRA